MQFNAGQKIGPWTLKEWLGGGGNGSVWLAVAESGEEIALKILFKNKPLALKRFRDEVALLKKNSDIEGILPVIDEWIPETPGSQPAWFGMPRAQGASKALLNATIFEKAKAMVQVAKTAAAIHARDIGHRDIKPSNILYREGRFYLADFGIAKFPKKEDLTKTKEDIGPRWTLAPEMRRDPKRADPRAADVYSLAKTLWIFLTKEEKGFEGQYNQDTDTSLRKYLPRTHLSALESLLTDATARTPAARPTMSEFATRLEDWIIDASDYSRHNPLDWNEAQRRLFPISIPTRASWTNIDDIISALKLLGSTSNLGHLFFPESGGLDLTGAAHSREEGCIELWVQGLFVVVKPVRLMFESFGYEPQWNYFRLEIEKLPPSGIEKDLDGVSREELTDIGGKFYAPRWVRDEGEYNGKPLPSGTKGVMRYITNGSFVLFQKTSFYNKASGTYRGKHSAVSADDFRSNVAGAVAAFRKLGIRLNPKPGK